MHWLGYLLVAPLRASDYGRVLPEQKTHAHNIAVTEVALGEATLLPT